MNTTKEIKKSWSSYDKSVAKAQLSNYGIIYLDKYDKPIDDEFLLEEVSNDIHN